ncbi:hypothetical protein HUS23_05275 [Ectothiorhodospiraceae bacterium 2226]|nr:hypothetical protein HUS23_05275 [Ectothiorhodospiraceae bacterium 2226]
MLSVPGREIYLVAGGVDEPACYLVQDKEAGGILINTPAFDEALLAAIQAAGGARFVFLPSRLGVRDLDRWRAALEAEAMAYEPEVEAIAGSIDITLDNKSKLTRTIDFLPMSGRTRGSCALRLKNLPGVVFFGPILEPGPDGWPTLVQHADDHSFESRMFGALGLQDVTFDYAFTDDFVPGATRFGPGAAAAVNAAVHAALEL